MERWVAKVLCLFGTFFLPLVCTLLPYKLSGCIASKGSSGKRILSYLMCLGGGIFFGTYLLHMGPEVQTILSTALLKPYNIHYPLAELVVGIGFFIVLFAEKLVLRWNKRRIRRKRRHSCHSNSQKIHNLAVVGKSETSIDFVVGETKCARPPGMGMCPECSRGEPCSGFNDGEICSESASEQKLTLPANGDSSSSARLLAQPVVDIEDLSSCAIAITTTSNCPMSGTGECCSDPPTVQRDWSEKEKHIIITTKLDEEAPKLAAKEDDEELDELNAGHHHATRSIILILALSLHRIFEGMSIGLQHTVSNVGGLFGAVMCHETVIGFSLGLQFVKSGFALQRLLITSLVCSSIMPLGLLIGLAMTELDSGGSGIDIANGLLQAIAMGTFIYVTFFEILQEEVDPEDTSLTKIVFIALGFTLMALLDLIPEEQTEQLVQHLLVNTTVSSTLTTLAPL